MHKLRRLLSASVLLLSMLCASVQAVEVTKIIVEGNKRVPDSSVIAFSQLAVGTDVTQADITTSIKAVYQRGLFDKVAIEVKGSVVIIKVKERLVIKKIDVRKNKLIPEEGLNDILKKSGLVAGEVLDPAKMKQFNYMVLNEYRMNGYPDARVENQIKDVGGGMADVKIVVIKGGQYQVRTVNIENNLAFPDRIIQSKMSLGTPNLYARLFGGNYYSKQAFEKSKVDLINFYMDEGFLKFTIESTTVKKIPGTKYVDITVRLNEGPRFMYSNIGIYGDKDVKSVSVPEIESLKSGIKSGQKLPFSRRDIVQLRGKIAKTFEEKGYSIKSIDPKIEPNLEAATIDLRFFVERGIPVTVRKIEFKGNTLTMDKVLRRELAMNEGQVYSESGVQESIRRLSNLGYLKNVQPQVKVVESEPREVDIIYSVEEAPEATANLEMGYNQSDAVVFSTSIVHPNFGGTGYDVDMKLEKSRVRTSISAKGNVPFVLRNGLGLGYKVFYTKQDDASNATTVSKYTWMQSYASEKMGVNFSATMPISLYQDLSLSAEVNKNNFSYDKDNAALPATVVQSIDLYGNNLWNLVINGRWARSTLDKAILPSSGNKEEVAIKFGTPLNESFTSYVTLDSRVGLFRKLQGLPITFNPTMRFGIGKGFRGFTNITGCLLGSTAPSCQTELPFDEKFYAYPPAPVRGVMTFGEKVNGKAIGGDLITTASMNVFLKPLNNDMVIPSLFVDGGYTFNKHDFDFSKWVYSAGLQVRVMTPVAPVVMVFAYPLKIDGTSSEYGKDSFRYFQFTMQANLY